jgi:hypothetical protein
MDVDAVLDSLHRQILLEIFRRIYKCLSEDNNNIVFKNFLRSKSTQSGTMLAYRGLISKVTPLKLSDNDVYQIIEWIKAFWEKSDERKQIPDSFRQKLLKKQGNRCACCGKNIEDSSHVDHIIPFKYTGDELPEENYRCLCENCNLNKSAILSTIITDICNGMYLQQK